MKSTVSMRNPCASDARTSPWCSKTNSRRKCHHIAGRPNSALRLRTLYFRPFVHSAHSRDQCRVRRAHDARPSVSSKSWKTRATHWPAAVPPNAGKTGYATGEIAGFWFLHAVNSGLAPLRHMYYSTHGHPEECISKWRASPGRLCTFTLEHHPRSIPAYDHLQPDKCFDSARQAHSRAARNGAAHQLHLHSAHRGRRLSALRHGHRSALSAVARRGSSPFAGNMGAAELMRKTPNCIKICSKSS